MNKTVKIILIILASLFLLTLTVCGAGYLWFASKQDELKAEGERLRAEASAFAKTSDQQGCVKESLERAGRCDPNDITGAVCRGIVSVFFKACLAEAKPAENFCEDVPKGSDIMASVKWSLDRCTLLGRANDHHCAKLVAEIPRFCSRE
jgi:hypothetical protein